MKAIVYFLPALLMCYIAGIAQGLVIAAPSEVGSATLWVSIFSSVCFAVSGAMTANKIIIKSPK